MAYGPEGRGAISTVTTGEGGRPLGGTAGGGGGGGEGINSNCSEELSNLSTVASNSFSLLDFFTSKHVTD